MLRGVPDIGPEVAKSIREWFNTEGNRRLIKKLKEVGVMVMAPARPAKGPLSGKTFVFTGSLKTLDRGEAAEMVRSKGGNISETVSSKTDYVVMGKDPGSKYEKAQKLSISILDEKEFKKMIK